MANDVSVSPTPIQRNKFDVATELVQLEDKIFGFENPEDIETSFAKYFSLVNKLDSYRHGNHLDNFVNEEINKKFKSNF